MSNDQKKSPPPGFYRSAVPGFILSHSYRSYVSARDRWVETLPQWSGQTIIDIGCGNGETLASYAKANRMMGYDLSPETLAEAAEIGFETFEADINALELPVGQADVVAALNVASMASDVEAFYRQLTEAVKPGGHVLITLATRGGLRRVTRAIITMLKVKHPAVYLPSPQQFIDDVQASGLEVEDVTFGFSPLNGWLSKAALARPFASFVYIKARRPLD